MKNNGILWILSILSGVLLSLPWLVPHAGAVALIAFVPLLFAEALAEELRVRRFWICHYSCFVVWNAMTTFWVCNATVGGGVFAVLVNALQMSLVFGLFRLARRRLGRSLPYVLLAAAWIAWERWYLRDAQISWPWLTLGNAFAGSTGLVQWYEYTGILGGSLWVWVSNLSVFAIIMSFADSTRRSAASKAAAALWAALVLLGPTALSRYILRGLDTSGDEGRLEAVVGQPNFDPYEKFTAMSQHEQDKVLMDMFSEAVGKDSSSVLFVAPETFTSDMFRDSGRYSSASLETYSAFLGSHPGSEMLFGASTYDITHTASAPSILSRQYRDGWVDSHNSAVLLSGSGKLQVTHKSKLVVGTELTPYPEVFVPFDDWLCRVFRLRGPLMGRCVGQKEVSVLSLDNGVRVGCAVCYESVYPEHVAGFVSKGADVLAVITNDAWWGDTPGYRQHLDYSRLRAIETRREIVRCGNTGISAFIDISGDVLQRSSWWEREVLRGSVGLHSCRTFFVRNGDVTGRACVFVFLLFAVLLLISFFIPLKITKR